MKFLFSILLIFSANLASAQDYNSRVEIKIDNSYLSSNIFFRTYSTEYFSDEFVNQAKEDLFVYWKAFLEKSFECNSVQVNMSESKSLSLSASCSRKYLVTGNLKMSKWINTTGLLSSKIYDLDQSDSIPILEVNEQL